MNRADLIARERESAASYRREAKRRSKNPALAARLLEFAEASDMRAEEFRTGPLFGPGEDAR